MLLQVIVVNPSVSLLATAAWGCAWANEQIVVIASPVQCLPCSRDLDPPRVARQIPAAFQAAWGAGFQEKGRAVACLTRAQWCRRPVLWPTCHWRAFAVTGHMDPGVVQRGGDVSQGMPTTQLHTPLKTWDWSTRAGDGQ